MSTMGIKIDQFDVPVCNSFQAKILNDQLCYEVDLNRFANEIHIDKDVIRNQESGFYFIMDYNEDRQFNLNHLSNESHEFGLARSLKNSGSEQHAFIYLNTIGKRNFLFKRHQYTFIKF